MLRLSQLNIYNGKKSPIEFRACNLQFGGYYLWHHIRRTDPQLILKSIINFQEIK
jgi:hypothetical protein